MARKNKRKPVWWIDTMLRIRHTFMPTKKSHYGIFINKKDCEYHAAWIRDVAMTVHG